MSRHSLLTRGLCASILAGAAFAPATLAAQVAGSGTTPAVRTSDSTYRVTSAQQTPAIVADSGGAVIGPRATPVAAHSQTAQTSFVVADQHVGAGSNLALAAVGGAGLIVGLLIGGKAGDAIAIGGALVGLYGLYLYLR